VFSNLLKNAIQAIPRNQKVRYVSVSATSDRDYVHINFTDNGMGIPEEIRDRIFLPNFTTKSSGSGLGLAIVNNIVDSNNGKISFTTTTGKGTTFTISFPLLES
jgi:signal transduction histidine kinase